MEGKKWIVVVHDKLNNRQISMNTYANSVEDIKKTLEPMKDFKFVSAEPAPHE